MPQRTFAPGQKACILAAIGMMTTLYGITASHAQSYPTVRPITFVIPAPPGGGSDAFGRALAQSMGKSLGQLVIVENKPGASGALAAQA